MKKKTGICLGALSAVIAGSLLLSGCGNGSQNAGYTLNDGSAGEYAITKDPVELSVFLVRDDGYKVEELPIWQEIAELTNVNLKTVNSTSISDTNQALNTLLASGDLPDMVVYSNIKDFAEEYGMEGAFVKLDELINDDTPNLQAQFERKVVKSTITASDGHIYYVPDICPEGIPANGWFIRQDWLDKLGLETPTNVEELYNVLTAFRNEDPNGNGIQDEVPYLYRFKSADALLEMQNVPTVWGVDENGQVYYSPITDEFKDGMKLIAQWYAEGLIDKEIYTRGSKSREKLFGDNVGGCTHDYFGTTAEFNNLLADSIPGFKLVAFAPPGGKEYSARAVATTSGAAISAASDKIDVALRFLDFLYSEKGSTYQNFGLEGVHYELQDGIPYYTDTVLNGTETASNILKSAGCNADLPYIQDFWYEEQWLTEEALKGFEMYEQNGYNQAPFPTLSYTKEEKDRYTVLNTSITTYVDEYKQKWVFGTSDVDATFDEFVSQVEQMGIGELTEIVQAAYDRYMAEE